jgi:hypothetical protein
MKKFIFLILIFLISSYAWGGTHYHLDPLNGNDTNNGTTWALAWKTLTTGASAATLVAGDTVLIAKSPDPVSIGNATWTDSSATVTLAGAQTANIDLCEAAGWDTAVYVNRSTDTTTWRKQGTYNKAFTIKAAFTTGIIAWENIANLDLAAYSTISLWMRTSADVAANSFAIYLCSDDAGVTPVDSIIVTTALKANRWCAVSISAGTLHNDIESIALYARLDPGAVTLYVDNILACNNLTLNSVIGKNTSLESWWVIQSINGTSVILSSIGQYVASGNTKYQGTTGTVATYVRSTFLTDVPSLETSTVNVLNESGTTRTVVVYYMGGCNTANENMQQDGETWLDGQLGFGYGLVFSGRSYINISNLGLVRYYIGAWCATGSTTDMINWNKIHANGCINSGFKAQNCFNLDFTSLFACQDYNHGLYLYFCTTITGDTVITHSNSTTGIYDDGTSDCVFNYVRADGNIDSGLRVGVSDSDPVWDLFFNNVITRHSVSCGISMGSGILHIENFKSLNEPAPFGWYGSFYLTGFNTRIQIQGYGQIADRYKTLTRIGNISDQITGGQDSAWAYGGVGLCVYLNPTSVSIPLVWKFKVPCTAGTAFTVSFYVKKTSSGANPTLTSSYYGSGITEVKNQSITLTDTWAKYTSASMTPTATGFVEVTLKAFDGSTTGDIGIDHITTSAGGYSDLGECDSWYYGMVDGGIIGDYFGEVDRWFYGLVDGGITNVTEEAPPVAVKRLPFIKR